MPDPISRAISEAIVAAWPSFSDPVRAAIAGAAELGVFLAIALVVAAAWLQSRGGDAYEGGAGGDSRHGRDLIDRAISAGRAVIPAGIAVAVAWLAVKGISAIVDEQRPFVVLGVAPLFAHVPDSSFPSEHTTLGFALLGARLRSRAAQMAIGLVVLVVGVARVLAGVHWPIDIAAGIVTGVGVAAIIGYAWDRLVPPSRVGSGGRTPPVVP